VVSAVVQVMKRWLDTGVDGFRLDAIPYLCERDGTNNENLPETHLVIKTIRRELDAYAKGKVLLAEANQWPEDVQEYFGQSDECHMAYHFPLMPRIYMAIGGPLPDHRHPAADAGHPRRLPMGAVPAQPRRIDAGDGDRRGARLSVVDLRQRSARAHQCRHPPQARAAHG
jgi:glycosidase